MAGSPLTVAVSTATEQDTELAEAARALAHKAIRLANQYLDTGSPQMKLNVIKAIMPAIGRGMVDKGESDEVAELRGAVDHLMSLLSGEPHVA